MELINKIKEADESSINSLKEKIYNDDRICSFISQNDLKNADTEFKNMTLEEKKKALILIIDKNKLYVNLSDINDEEFKINSQDKKFTESFYKGV